jgi:hypothetical protein
MHQVLRADQTKRLPLNAIILHLNDDHHWTREQIVVVVYLDALTRENHTLTARSRGC